MDSRISTPQPAYAKTYVAGASIDANLAGLMESFMTRAGTPTTLVKCATNERVNLRRRDQLLETKPDMIASACPFCQRMLIDGLAAESREEVRQLDIAEILWESVSAAESQNAPPA